MSVFEELFFSCFKRIEFYDLGSYFDYYVSIKVFYFKMVVGVSLDVLL